MEEARNVLRLANKSKSVDLTVARDESEETVSYRKTCNRVLHLTLFATFDVYFKAN